MLSQQPAGVLCHNMEVTYICNENSTVLSFIVTTTTPVTQEKDTFLDRADTSSMSMFTLRVDMLGGVCLGSPSLVELPAAVLEQ